MLQNLRDNLKGTVAVVVIIIFVVPLVLFGVEQLFVGSIGGNDEAEVNGQGISNVQYRRALQQEQNRRAAQMNLEPDSPQLEESVLRQPVLERLARAEALVQEARSGGMAASKNLVWSDIYGIDAFKTDGKFDKSKFQELIGYQGYTGGTFVNAMQREVLLNLMSSGIANSAFTTESDFEMLAAISQQKRSFFSLTIPKERFDDTSVTEEEISNYYQQNQARYMQPETVVVEYLETSLEQLAKDIKVTDEQVKPLYDEEVQSFVSDPKLMVAHILIKKGDNQEATIAKVESELANGGDFAKLAGEYSEDLGSKSKGGQLGELLEEAYPKAFVSAAKALQKGEVSEPVKTDSGTHFIKLVDIKNVEAPSFADRKAALKQQLSLELAQDKYVQKISELDEKTFGQVPLKNVASDLGLSVKTSQAFGKSGGTGIAANAAVTTAAFSDEVLAQGYNSAVLELPGSKAVVLSVKEHKPAAVKPLAEVKAGIEQQLKREKVSQQLAALANEVKAKIDSKASAEALAKEGDYTFEAHELASRSDFKINGSVLRKAFALPRPSSAVPLVLDGVSLPNGSYAIVGVTDVANGSIEDMEEAQLSAMKQQLLAQMAQREYFSFEESVYSSADVKIPE